MRQNKVPYRWARSEAVFFQKRADKMPRPARSSDRNNSTEAGSVSNATTISVHCRDRLGSISQPTSSTAKVATSERLRRRLSKICQREIALNGFGTSLPNDSGTRGKSHRPICQSPRTQRCFRRLYALTCEG